MKFGIERSTFKFVRVNLSFCFGQVYPSIFMTLCICDK